MEIGCVGIVEHNGLYLVSKRIPDGYWQFPGGKMDEDETPRLGVIREILEEVGIKVIPRSDVSFIYTGHLPKYITFFYRCDVLNSNLPSNPEPEKSEGAVWMSAGDIAVLPDCMTVMHQALNSVVYPDHKKWEREKQEGPY